MENNRFYVYIHTKPDGTPFYVGKGTGRRAYMKTNRNKHWKNTISKYENYRVDIFKDKLNENDANNLEIILIKAFGRMDLSLGTLVNMTNGGECGNDRPTKHKDETKKKISKAMSIIKKGNKIWLGRKHKDSSKLKLSISKIGELNPMFGKKPKEESINHLIKFNKENRSKLVLDIETGIYYNSVIEAAELLGYSKSTLASRLNGRLKNNTNLRYA